MLLEHAEENGLPFKLMASQPRRIAASSLMKRLRTSIGNKVGMRMGHGIKDEYDETCLYFVTTGYLVRCNSTLFVLCALCLHFSNILFPMIIVLAHQLNSFHSYTHIVVDEVHERYGFNLLVLFQPMRRRFIIYGQIGRRGCLAVPLQEIAYNSPHYKDHSDECDHTHCSVSVLLPHPRIGFRRGVLW